MSDVDSYLFSVLQHTKCLPSNMITIENNVEWIHEISSDSLIYIVLECLEVIDESIDDIHIHMQSLKSLQSNSGVASKHRLGSQIAMTLKELGYAGDCGYNHFLYPNDKDTRAILSWIVSKLPGNVQEVISVTSNTISKQEELVGDYADRIVNPSPLSREGIENIFSAWKQEKTLPNLRNRTFPQLKGFQCFNLCTSPVLLPWNKTDNQNTQALVHPSLSGGPTSWLAAIVCQEDIPIESIIDVDMCTEFDVCDDEDGDVAKVGIDERNFDLEDLGEEEDQLRTETISHVLLENAVDHTKTDGLSEVSLEDVSQQETTNTNRNGGFHYSTDSLSLTQVIEQLEELKGTVRQLKRDLTIQKKILAHLPDQHSGICKLETAHKKLILKRESQEKEWEEHKLQVEFEEKRLISIQNEKQLASQKIINKIKQIRIDMRELSKEFDRKVREAMQLDKMRKKLPLDAPLRETYTSRIMDTTKQIHKQQKEITKIIDDVTAMQKQLNVTSEKLKRSEAVTEDKLYTAANKASTQGSRGLYKYGDSEYVECYRKFAEIRELFEELILIVGDVGKKENTSRDLMNWISQLESRESSQYLDKVLTDLHAVKQENETLSIELADVEGIV